jgi:predicted unusual protein kinase regulating ubiquinone biosynthesis (AarF/ABC1/UbiB family)
MSEDLNKKIKQITDILGQENMPDNIKGLLSLLANPSPAIQTESEAPKTAEITPVPRKEEKSGRNEMEENLEMIRKVKKIMDRVNTKDDPRINLLTAIKPFLNSTRQKKLSNCVKLLQMHNITRFIDEQDKNFY